MQLKFYKYQATGNDFVLVDNRQGFFPKKDARLIERLCHRRFGIGADGLILLEQSDKADFAMRYFNADGAPGSFCGNGSRAIVSFANYLGVLSEKGVFEASDGLHTTVIKHNLIEIRMADVQNGRPTLAGTFIDTGSPHYVEQVEDVNKIDVIARGRELRHHTEFAPGGANINFVQQTGASEITVRTYERGVENETLSCGTGVTAAAIACCPDGQDKVTINTRGGKLAVRFKTMADSYQDVWLSGPAEQVFSGEIII